MTHRSVAEVARTLLEHAQELTTRRLAEEAGVSRQAAHQHLHSLVALGHLHKEGRGRATRYVRVAGEHWLRRYERLGLAEDRVWQEMEETAPALRELPPATHEIFHYALTEMVNNAIDHSRGESVCVELFPTVEGRLAFRVVDDGIGIFEHLREALGLGSHLEALQHLTKGKVTTQPERHSGEGIFFTSKIADLFTIESCGIRWVVDSVRDDVAIETVPDGAGTRVHFEIAPRRERSLQALFEEYTDDLQFSRTRTYVKLFEYGVRFVSRSEAKRLMRGLEKFREVILDFNGVLGIGQGFADEVFRVWSRLHPGVLLTPVSMSETVAFMVERTKRSVDS